MLLGRIKKAQGSWWFAECEIVGAWTQDKSRKRAAAMLADCIETKVNQRGFKVTVREIAEDSAGITVAIDANESALLATEVLKYQREIRGPIPAAAREWAARIVDQWQRQRAQQRRGAVTRRRAVTRAHGRRARR